MFRFHGDMQVAAGVKDPLGVKRMLADGVAVLDTFALCVRPGGGGLMEMLHTPQLFKSVHADKRYIIIGLAAGREECLALLTRILDEYVRSGGALEDFKNGFLDAEGEYDYY